MKKLVLIILTLLFVVSTTYATQINLGETVCDSISEPAEVDSYVFLALANDNVLVRISRCSGSWFPSMQVYGPDGTLLCEATLGNPTAEIESCTLPNDGIYTILAYDYWGTDTGEYNLYLGCLNPPCGEAEPSPDIKVNGSDGPLFITPSDSANVSVLLDPGDILGVSCDWWVGALTPFGTYWVNPSLSWIRSDTPISVGQYVLFNLSEKSLLNRPLPVGIYTFFFTLDDTPNGIYDLTWYDYVNVICQGGGSPAATFPDFEAIFQER